MVEFCRIQWVGGKAKINRKGRQVEGVGLSLARHGEGGQGGPDNMGKGRDGEMLEEREIEGKMWTGREVCRRGRRWRNWERGWSGVGERMEERWREGGAVVLRRRRRPKVVAAASRRWIGGMAQRRHDCVQQRR